MSNHADFLVEILTEELPPKTLQRLAEAFLTGITTRLIKAELAFKEAHSFVTPRRLAVSIHQLDVQQKDAVIDRKGPLLAVAFDSEGHPTPACVGFARSCGVLPEALITFTTEQGEFVGYQQKITGKKVKTLLPSIVSEALQALPIPKRMRWGKGAVEFIRPVHAVMMLQDSEVIEADILGCRADRKTKGHRFLSEGWISLSRPSDYVKALEKKYVIADFSVRKEKIRAALLASVKDARVVIDEALLDEVTGLVEWPVVFRGQFDSAFLKVPQEALISAMQDHQRYFPVVDSKGQLLPQFIAVSNIKSKNPSHVIAGNERVLRARLSDAAFFFETDKKESLIRRVETLKTMVFQAKLGTLFNKAERLSHLAGFIAKKMHLDETVAKKAALLAKADLTTTLVGEFPELQGIAGFYYALNDGESHEIALSLREHYLPRFSGDTLPETQLGCILALADRLDTLVGIFGIHQPPTGDKDPFGLRRAALGALRILIEKKINLDVRELIQEAEKNYAGTLDNKNTVNDVVTFMWERLKPWYQEQGISMDVFSSVAVLDIAKPYDMDCRIRAVQAFKQFPEAASLSIANKRVSNILAKYDSVIAATQISAELFEHDSERVLASALAEQQHSVNELSKGAQYVEVLTQLSTLRTPVDGFFDTVLVMAEDKPRRENRLLLLKQLRELFLHVADIALLQ
jgi:glycyl-tRNA synthetase beta chain